MLRIYRNMKEHLQSFEEYRKNEYLKIQKCNEGRRGLKKLKSIKIGYHRYVLF